MATGRCSRREQERADLAGVRSSSKSPRHFGLGSDIGWDARPTAPTAPPRDTSSKPHRAAGDGVAGAFQESTMKSMLIRSLLAAAAAVAIAAPPLTVVAAPSDGPPDATAPRHVPSATVGRIAGIEPI